MPPEFDFHFDGWFLAGLILSLAASTWYMFASYAGDARVARRWWRGPSIEKIRHFLDHKDRLLVPWALWWIGLLLMVPTMIRFWRAFLALWDKAAGH